MKPESCAGCPCLKMGDDFSAVEIGARYDSARVLVVAEASGENEAREGLPLRPHAQAGSMFADALRQMNISRNEIAITNCLRCRPKNDWLEGAPYAGKALSQCVNTNLKAAIEELKPRVILALGGTAFRQLVDVPRGRQGTLDYIRGYAMHGAGMANGIPVVATYHPAHIKRGKPNLTPLVWRDLRRAFLIGTGKLIEGQHYILDPMQRKGDFQTSPSLAEAWEWYRAMDLGRTAYLDIETPKSAREDEDERTSFADRDINLIQFTQHRGRGIALPWREEFIDVAKAVLASRTRKVGHNIWGFDIPVLEANGVEVNVEAGCDDTMLMFHHYQPDLPANLQAVAQYFGYPMAWKHLSDSEPALYGCLDVDATCWADEVLMPLLEREGLASSYREYVAEVWPIYRDMSKRGVPVSEQYRAEFKKVIDVQAVRVDEAIKAMVPEEVLGQKQKNGYKNPPILKCEDCDYKGRGDHICTIGGDAPNEDGEPSEIQNVAIPYPTLAEQNGLVYREVTIGEEEKCRCTKKTRESCAICVGSGIIPAGLIEMRWGALTEFNPNSSHQVKRYMRYRKHQVPKHGKRTDMLTGEAAETTEVKGLERLFAKTKDKIYPLLIEKRQLTKMEGTYHDGFAPWADGAVHSTPTFGPATWQTSSKNPNSQTHPKRGRSEFQKNLVKSFRSMIRAREGRVLVNFDWKAFHALTTGLEAESELYMRIARNDMHSFVACHWLKLPERIGLLNRDDEDMKALFEWLRKNKEGFDDTRGSKTKPVGLGIGFGQRPKSIYEQRMEDFNNVKEVQAIWDLMMVELFPDVAQWQKRTVEEAHEEKKLLTKFNAIRWFHDAMHWDRRQQRLVNGDQAEAAIAFRPANDAFGHCRWVLKNIREKEYDERYQLYNNVHDSLEFECPIELVEECKVNIAFEMRRASPTLVHRKLAPNGLVVDVDVATGPSMAELY